MKITKRQLKEIIHKELLIEAPSMPWEDDFGWDENIHNQKIAMTKTEIRQIIREELAKEEVDIDLDRDSESQGDILGEPPGMPDPTA